jgi:hypothetical protein
MVIPAAKTGKEIINKILVKKRLQANKGRNRRHEMTEWQEDFKVVTIKLIAPINDDNPTKWIDKNIRSTEEELIIERGT